MLEIKFVRENVEAVKAGALKKGFKNVESIDEIINLDDERRSIQKQLDDSLAEMNVLSKTIGELFKEGKAQEANEAKAKTADVKERSAGLKVEHDNIAEKLNDLLVQIPNMPHESVPNGLAETDNEIIKEVGVMPQLAADAKPHWDLAEKYHLIDFEKGVKIAGAGFPVYMGKGARLQRALIAFFLDEAGKAGYTEVQPPVLANKDSAYATGQLPDKEGQMYYVTADDLYLIPTSEVPLTNLYRSQVVAAADLPISITGHSQCFRREAGSYGKEVRGLNRLHQFDKVEIVRIERPENSYNALKGMLDHVEGLLDKLGLPYRILRLCGGDLTFASALTYDFEVYSAAQKMWLEVSSCSNFETFQSNRLKLRVKDGKDKFLAHTLNGSAIALPRIMASLIENNQTENGIRIPEALIPYTGFDLIS